MFTKQDIEGPRLIDTNGTTCPLVAVHIHGTIDDVLTTFTINQTYTNESSKAIEALYTFPIPMSATFLDMQAHFGERTLKGTVQPSANAEKGYNKAIEDGNAAILLKEVDAGLYHASFGNLKPGETAIIEYRYVMQHTWSDRFLRVHLPTTIAPRYGKPAKAGLSDAASPEYVAQSATNWSFTIDVSGKLATYAITCPNHRLMTKATETGLSISLNTLPDRDMVLDFESESRPNPVALCDTDRDGYIVAADFMPRFQTERTPLNLDILIDCSGSMTGQSIAQAKEGLRLILDRLSEGDFFNITAFGSSHKSLFKERQSYSRSTLEKARTFLRSMDADMGGTETGAALSHVYQLGGGKGPRNILLITDGEIWSADKLYTKAKNSGCRIMTVGVGMAAAEKTVRKLAEVTGGMCEMVSPNEDMARRIERHCMRIACPVLKNVRVVAEGALVVYPNAPSAVYDGDTVHVFAKYTTKPSGQIMLEAQSGNETYTWTCAIPNHLPVNAGEQISELARMATAYRLRNMTGKDKDEGQQLALDYQLLSQWTSCLLVDVRADGDKADTLPTAVKVPQMVASGWHGGMAGVSAVMSCCLSSPFTVMARMMAPRNFLARNTELDTETVETPDELLDFMRAYSENCGKAPAERKAMTTLGDLLGLGLPAGLADTVRAASGKLSEEELCTFLMACLLDLYADGFGEEATQWISRCKARLHAKNSFARILHKDVSSWIAKAS